MYIYYMNLSKYHGSILACYYITVVTIKYEFKANINSFLFNIILTCYGIIFVVFEFEFKAAINSYSFNRIIEY